MLLHVNILRSILREIMSYRLKLFSFITYLDLSCIYNFSKRLYARTYMRMSGHALVKFKRSVCKAKDVWCFLLIIIVF